MRKINYLNQHYFNKIHLRNVCTQPCLSHTGECGFCS